MCLGSPLGVFLQMRQTPITEIIPAHITRLFNLFHPVDVVAYRLEPLLAAHYALCMPARVDSAQTISSAMVNPDYDAREPEMYKARKAHVIDGNPPIRVEFTSVGDGGFELRQGLAACRNLADERESDITGLIDRIGIGQPGLLEHPHYTRPQTWENREIPAVLTSGDHTKVAAWRRNQAEELTKARRPDLYAASRDAPLPRAKPRD